MQIEPVVLENAFARLEPLGLSHREDLRDACEADPAIWTELYPYSWAGAHFEPTWARVIGDIAAGRAIVYAVTVDGRCVGVSGFGRMEPANAGLEIGGTYYRPEVRGGAVNPAAKRLMMAHAFDSGARRVSYRVDAANARSRAAVTKRGAVQEGILRQDVTCWTGRIRDTVIFSILANEWPGVRDRLDARLAAFG
jgi:RimJ/RimL family protein N-acetyltransferase